MLIERNAPDVLESDTFRAYSAQLSEAKAEYEVAKAELEKEYIPRILKGHQYRWNLDFGKKVLKVDILCVCGIEAITRVEAGHEAQ